ncbi:MAG: hypothetical protein Q4G24_14820, partial [Paracoccus sp. (in: a-proteobacteria)]|nr:hypothetical protein [Paracoccus sp. (in: a-proteobacteria)]
QLNKHLFLNNNHDAAGRADACPPPAAEPQESTPMGISRRQYATLRGVSEAAVRKAVTSGRITPEADSSIDPEPGNQH